MKLTSNTIGLLIFLALATTAFVYMAKRPAIEGNSIVFGMPINKAAEAATPATDEKKAEEPEAKKEDPAKEEATPSTEADSSPQKEEAEKSTETEATEKTTETEPATAPKSETTTDESSSTN